MKSLFSWSPFFSIYEFNLLLAWIPIAVAVRVSWKRAVRVISTTKEWEFSCLKYIKLVPTEQPASKLEIIKYLKSIDNLLAIIDSDILFVSL